MRGLFEIRESLELEPITATTLRRWLEQPSDPLQAWLLEHIPCAVALRDAVVLAPLGGREDGSVMRRGRCHTCGVDDELVTGSCREDARVGGEWIGALLIKAVATYPEMCLPAVEGRFAAVFRVMEALLTECDLQEWAAAPTGEKPRLKDRVSPDRPTN